MNTLINIQHNVNNDGLVETNEWASRRATSCGLSEIRRGNPAGAIPYFAYALEVSAKGREVLDDTIKYWATVDAKEQGAREQWLRDNIQTIFAVIRQAELYDADYPEELELRLGAHELMYLAGRLPRSAALGTSWKEAASDAYLLESNLSALVTMMVEKASHVKKRTEITHEDMRHAIKWSVIGKVYNAVVNDRKVTATTLRYFEKYELEEFVPEVVEFFNSVAKTPAVENPIGGLLDKLGIEVDETAIEVRTVTPFEVFDALDDVLELKGVARRRAELAHRKAVIKAYRKAVDRLFFNNLVPNLDKKLEAIATVPTRWNFHRKPRDTNPTERLYYEAVSKHVVVTIQDTLNKVNEAQFGEGAQLLMEVKLLKALVTEERISKALVNIDRDRQLEQAIERDDTGGAPGYIERMHNEMAGQKHTPIWLGHGSGDIDMATGRRINRV